jgi:uroporphyrinogen-III decarboxylase
MDIVTQSHVQCVQFFHQMAGRQSDAPIWTGADSAEMVSPDMFREFVVPAYLQMWSNFKGPRTFHMCGRITHLLDIIRDDLKIDILDGFGFPVPPELHAQKLAGRIVLKGGFSPVLVHRGPIAEIQEQTRHYMNLLAPHGGFIMSLGGGAAVGTPVAHFQAVIDTARQWTPPAA